MELIGCRTTTIIINELGVYATTLSDWQKDPSLEPHTLDEKIFCEFGFLLAAVNRPLS
jgi:hypothetical protein